MSFSGTVFQALLNPKCVLIPSKIKEVTENASQHSADARSHNRECRGKGREALTMSALSALPALRDRNWAPK